MVQTWLNWAQIREKSVRHPSRELNPGPQDLLSVPQNYKPSVLPTQPQSQRWNTRIIGWRDEYKIEKVLTLIINYFYSRLRSILWIVIALFRVSIQNISHVEPALQEQKALDPYCSDDSLNLYLFASLRFEFGAIRWFWRWLFALTCLLRDLPEFESILWGTFANTAAAEILDDDLIGSCYFSSS